METETKPKRRAQRRHVDARYEELKQMLITRQRELLDDLHGRIRSVRDEGSPQDHTCDLGNSGVDVQDDLEFALIQMKAETANKISEALARLEKGRFGLCFECGERLPSRGCARCLCGPLHGSGRSRRDGRRRCAGRVGVIGARLRDGRLNGRSGDYARASSSRYFRIRR